MEDSTFETEFELCHLIICFQSMSLVSTNGIEFNNNVGWYIKLWSENKTELSVIKC